MSTQPTRINWDLARKEYLSDATITLTELAERFNISRKSMSDRATKEGWQELRKDLSEIAFDEFQKKLVDEKSKAQNRHLLVYNNLQHILSHQITALARGEWLKDKKGNLIFDDDGKPIPIRGDVKNIEVVTRTAKMIIDGERTVLGLPTGISGLTDGKGEDVFKGFAEAVREAEKILEDE